MTEEISYELALKLKNAGFPQGSDTNNYICACKDTNHGYGCEWSETAYRPNLSKIIEECVKLAGTKDFYLELNEGGSWGASVDGYYVEGKTPEVACSNLYLELRGE